MRSCADSYVVICSHGQDILLLERRQFLQILYEKLPNKSHIKTSSVVVAIKEDSNSVEVKLGNGTVEVGDMVLGCDGVRSMVRTCMWDNANLTNPGKITAKEKTSKLDPSFPRILLAYRNYVKPL